MNSAGYLQWSLVPGATTYYIEEDNTNNIATLGGSAHSYFVQPNGQAHSFNVIAWAPGWPLPQWSTTVTEPPLNLKEPEGQLCWDAVAGHNNGTTDAYLVSINGSVSLTAPSWPCSPVLDSYNLVAGHEYTAQVASNDNSTDLQESDWGTPLKFTFEPRPANFQATPTTNPHGGISLSWNATPGGNVFYKIYRDGALYETGQSGGGIDWGVAYGSTHCYSVVAYYNGVGGQAPGESEQSQTSCATAS